MKKKKETESFGANLTMGEWTIKETVLLSQKRHGVAAAAAAAATIGIVTIQSHTISMYFWMCRVKSQRDFNTFVIL